MTDKAAIRELRERVEAARFDAPLDSARAPYFNRFMDCAETALPQDVRGCSTLAWGAYKGSLDAALALHEAVLPGWSWGVHDHLAIAYPPFGSRPVITPIKILHDIPARAWLIAILKAMEND